MYRDDSEFRDPDRDQRDATPMTLLGYDGLLAVYRGSDGQLYAEDPNGPAGYARYTGSRTEFSPTPETPTAPDDGPDRATATPPPAPAPNPSPNPSPNPGTIGGILSPFTGTFTPPTPQYGLVPPTPEFHPPTYTPPPAFSYPDFAYEGFVAPTAQDALNDPGYQFARDEGQQAIERSKAAGGVLNTGGTLKDILAWGQNYAATRYNDVYGRRRDTYDVNRSNAADVYTRNRGNAVDTYNTNYQTQYFDPYQIAYKSALDAFAPQMTAYTTRAAAGQRQNELDYRNAWDRFQFDYDKWRDQRDSTFNKTFQYVNA
jgi:hypothetical protein